MHEHTDSHSLEFQTGDRVSGYVVTRIVPFEAVEGVFYELEHEATGARHVHVSRPDAENTFSVAFKTVPRDSTGVAHILEHTVLCGSRKYPVRDPFFSMLKRSLNTFMNAFTASDWTMYPFSTQNRKDFYNLMDVYLDSVFHPRLAEFSFKQEGIRLEVLPAGSAVDLADPGSFRLEYKGVVYNEMKGAMSSQDQVMVRSLLNALYPDTTYSYNSGGDPAVIPDLTHEALKAFHARHYHPSNAFFYTYGNLPLKDHLEFIHGNYLRHFEKIDPQTEVPSQPRWAAPREVSYTYPLDREEDPARKSQVSVAWLMADIRDSFEMLALALLEQILLGNPASPLRRALIESGLGSALADGTGFDGDNKDTMFACGLKGVEPSAAEEIEGIIFGVLEDLADKGVDKTLIESAIHQLEFSRKEVTNHPYPFGLKLLLYFGGSWFHGGDPVRAIQFDADLEKIRERLARERFFEQKIRAWFLENPHRVRFLLLPDQDRAEADEKETAAKLEAIRAGLSTADLARIQADTENLQKMQEQSEDISVLPTLSLEDIPPRVQTVVPSPAPDGMPASTFAQPTAGIFYFMAAAGIGSLPRNLLPLAPFFCHAMTKMGTRQRDYAELAQLLHLYTGGIGLSANARTRYGTPDPAGAGKCIPYVGLGGKSLVRNEEKLFDILQELLLEFSFTDHTWLRNLLLEYRAGLETMVVHQGHTLAISLASRNFSTANALNETWNGIHQLKFVKDMTENLDDEKLAFIGRDLSAIGRSLFFRGNIEMAAIGDQDAVTQAAPPVRGLAEGLAAGDGGGFEPPALDLSDAIPREGWTTASAVSFVAQSFETVRLEHEDAPALAVISKMLRSMYLHREIREKGGAYGGFAVYNAENGLFCFGSYRDPHVVSTLGVYEQAGRFITSGNYSDEDVKEAILQVCSQIDRPDPPGPAAQKAFMRRIVGLTDDMRNQYKERLLAVDRHRVREVAEKHFQDKGRKAAVAVISNAEKLKAANEQLSESPLHIQRI